MTKCDTAVAVELVFMNEALFHAPEEGLNDNFFMSSRIPVAGEWITRGSEYYVVDWVMWEMSGAKLQPIVFLRQLGPADVDRNVSRQFAP